MKVEVVEECGHKWAIKGMAYSFKDREESPTVWWQRVMSRALDRAKLLAPKDGGHNKFLESITVYIDVEASRAFWSEFDTYRVGMTKQSESTMHTLSKRPPTDNDFEVGTHPEVVDTFRAVWYDVKGDVTALKMNLPEGFLQRRMICTNYKVLKNIFEQRRGHRLKWWDVFIDKVMEQLRFPEYLKG